MDKIIFLLVLWNLILTAGWIIIAVKVDEKTRDDDLREGLKGWVFGDIIEWDYRKDSFIYNNSSLIEHITSNYDNIQELRNDIEQLEGNNKSTLEKFCENYICGED